MSSLSRREFLKGSALLAAGAATLSLTESVIEAAPAQNPQGGPNDRLNVAVIGIRGRGRSHIAGFGGRNNCRVTHLCDADSSTAADAINYARKQQGGADATFVQDLRRIMENRDIHIVAIATPNHWHALAAIWAMQAGKDVYVEKPVSHNVSEGRRIVEVARRHNKICQAGTQIRSSTNINAAIQLVRSGKLGRLRVARGLCYKRRDTIGRVNGAGNVPNTIDYNLWCGPAPQRPPRRNRVHYDWHWQWDYGNGDLGNQGIHQVDVARWGIGSNQLARSVLSVGGRFGYVDDGETANTQIAVFDYGDAEMIFEVRGLPTKQQRNVSVGNIFHCADGYLVIPSYNGAVAYGANGQEVQRFNQAGDNAEGQHFTNFVNAVRSRRSQDLKGEILEGHLSSALCHLANISYRLGQQQAFQPRNAKLFGNNQAATDTLISMEEHLAANNVQLANSQLTVGPRLTLDVKAERFVDNAQANAQLTRQYRKGFEVPAQG
jgi:predicted dehydrogenase